MKVKVIRIYSDTTLDGKVILPETELEVTEERGEVLIKAEVAVEIKGNKKQEVQEETETEKVTRKRTTKK